MSERRVFTADTLKPNAEVASFSSSSASIRAGEKLRIEKSKESGGEGGIARGRGRPLVLRFAPDRRG